MAIAMVVIQAGMNDVLATFPYSPDQYISDEDYDGDGNTIVTIDLGGRDDLTVAQEQYLNTTDGVLSYIVGESE